MAILYKEGVNGSEGLRKEILDILPILEECFKEEGEENLTITCTIGDHNKNDPHSNGFAIDIRMHDFDVIKQEDLYHNINKTLSGLYFTQLEFKGEMKAHLHIQVYKGVWKGILDREKTKRG